MEIPVYPRVAESVADCMADSNRYTKIPMTRLLLRSESIVFFLALMIYGATSFDQSPFNEQVRQAFAFIHGHITIDAPQSFLEHAQVGGYSYALHPPLPAFLLMPFVAIWGMGTNQTMFSVLIGAINVMLTWMLLFRLNSKSRIWLTLFFGFGTIVWYETAVGTTWALPMTTAVMFELLTLIELFGEARPLWVGIFAALAALARYEVALAAPIYAFMLWRKERPILWMLPGFLAVGAIYAGLNEVRYGSLLDRGLWYIPNVTRVQFGWRYLPGNLYTLLFMAPRMDDTFPYLHPVFTGQALTLTSPAFVLALRPSFKRFEVSMMGLAAAVVSIPMLFHFANGAGQFGCRHWVPAFPFLLVMMAIGMPRRTDQLSKILICVSIFLVAFGVWQIHVWGLNGP